jgi:hypothetical protein
MVLIYFYQNKTSQSIYDYYFLSIKKAVELGCEIHFITHKNLFRDIDGVSWYDIDDYDLPVVEGKEGFWNFTINRYFYIFKHMLKYKLEDCFHMEGDVVLYTDLDTIKKECIKGEGFFAVRDAPDRAIGSLCFISNARCIFDFCLFCKKHADKGYNDMTLLGLYPRLREYDFSNGLIDGACLGQLLYGTHQNPSVPFVNETATFKPEIKKIKKIDGIYYYDGKKIHLLHIHSKRLDLFVK